MKQNANDDFRRKEDVLALVHKLQVNRIELEMQNEALKREKHEAEVALAKYSDLYDFAPMGLFTLDKDRAIYEVNLAGAELLGAQRSHLLNKCFELYVILNDRPTFNAFCERALFTMIKQKCKLELIKSTGEKIYAYIEGKATEKPAQDLRLAVIDITDITERKREETTLLESEAKLAAAFRASPDLMAVTRLADGKILEVNDGYSRMLGYSREESIGKTAADLAIWVDLDDRKKFTATLGASGRIMDFETRLRRKDGSVITVIDSARTITLGGEVCILSVAHDFTDRKKKEETILRAKEDWERTFDSVPDLIAIIDKEYRIIRANKAMATRLGVSPEECVGLTCYHAVHSTTEPPSFCPHRQLIEDGLDHAAEIHEDLIGGDFIVSVSPLIGPEGKLTGSVHVARDITERKRVEEALQYSEGRLAAIIDFLPDATFVIDSEKKVIAWNRAIQEMTGVKKENMIGKGDYAYTIPFYGERRGHLLDLIDVDDKNLASKYQYVKRKGNTLYAETFTPALNGGKGAYVWATGAPLFDNKSNRIGAIESIRDITEFKKTERTLREQLNFLQQLIDSIPNPIFYKDTKGVYLGCNKAFETITGYSRDLIVDHTVYELYPKEFADVYHEADNKLFQNPGVQIYEATMAHTDGSKHDVMFSKATYFDTEGRLAGLVGIILDITERKRMEIALKESERRLGDIINFLPDATLVIDINGNVIAWNRAIEEMTGIRAKDILGKGAYEYALPFYGERRPILVDLVLQPKSEIKRKYSGLKWVDGTLVGYAITPELKGVGAYLWGVASPIYDIHGKIVGAIESIKDFTEQKRMEEDLQESKDYLDKIINSIGDPLFVKDRQHKMTLVNDAACKLWGRPREEIIGKTAYDLFSSKEMAEISWMKDEEVFNAAKEVTNEETNTYADKILTVLVKKTPYTDKAGNQFLVGVTRDISDRKQAEDRIMASLKEKEILLKEVHHRVKNNLQVISALLYLQSSNLTDENIIKIFQDSQNRIKSMALIHENLYRSKDIGQVDFNEYISKLVSHLTQSYGDLSREINFKLNSQNVYLNINTAIPCGMIINELVSNSLKHAFKDGRSGEISIDLSQEDDGFKLIVSDNGVGIKGELNIKESKTLGFRLIDTLVKQIDGTLSLDTTKGFICEIHFKGLK